MKRMISILLAVMLIASVAVISVSAGEDDTATVTLYNLKGESVTQTYKVGDTFTATMYLNAKALCYLPDRNGNMIQYGIGSVNGAQTYTNAVLTLADSYDAEDGMIDDLDAMFPMMGNQTVANGMKTVTDDDPDLGAIYYNSSIASNKGFQFITDDAVMITANYTVTAPGNAEIRNSMLTLAASDFTLTRIIDRGEIKQSGFYNAVELSEPPVAEGSTVSGTITSFLSSTKEITVKLIQDGTVIDTTTTTGKSAQYSFSNVPDGEYTIRFSKKDHATRDYTITVSGDTTRNAKIHALGDIDGDGKVNAKDYGMVSAHAQKVTFLTGYQLACGDVVKNDGKITAPDAARVGSHAQKVDLMWVVED